MVRTWHPTCRWAPRVHPLAGLQSKACTHLAWTLSLYPMGCVTSLLQSSSLCTSSTGAWSFMGKGENLGDRRVHTSHPASLQTQHKSCEVGFTRPKGNVHLGSFSQGLEHLTGCAGEVSMRLSQGVKTVS